MLIRKHAKMVVTTQLPTYIPFVNSLLQHVYYVGNIFEYNFNYLTDR